MKTFILTIKYVVKYVWILLGCYQYLCVLIHIPQPQDMQELQSRLDTKAVPSGIGEGHKILACFSFWFQTPGHDARNGIPVVSFLTASPPKEAFIPKTKFWLMYHI